MARNGDVPHDTAPVAMLYPTETPSLTNTEYTGNKAKLNWLTRLIIPDIVVKYANPVLTNMIVFTILTIIYS